ncbi:N,N'-diacetylchitobiose transport system permease protein [Saccharopolyspora antimicrobica]|uniref:Carbohydrate ABC transporter membrane protein 1 (CUT1 family) n=2 Tax=Saccharopolyspora TaxID=1835 RepID=A0A1I5KC89_9PSEU|nr:MULTISPECIES: sugar ABC transporter permease [Saccharopolyspora]RKT81935.1 carbohydrate ABC transporter membrane protein 1 (CUT1 family) [Saccharopolyspora antimicrobica]SEG97858.1 N,N'-diacetylchitobiose transport system permease protein [Saccharopolyspora kobensis]SFF24159.1 carbohydrate ABC transporter membrane protein 1, CUT1 family [Saccharopolyspora kobensis]SFO82343.1 N,N'-diacetylchitobiose transport system permease protein [Saccharopolyspora antimicrobica]
MAALLYLAPAGLLLVVMMGYPLYQLVQISLYEYGQAQASGGAALEFLGAGNYLELLGDPKFWTILVQTCLFAAVCVVGSLAVGIGLAVLATRISRVPRLLLFLAAIGAWATPAMAGSTVWLFLFDQDFGLVNEVLTGIGIDGAAGFSWTYDKFIAFGLVAAEVIWCSFPFVLVTTYAGLSGIPGEVVEAASLDGASAWRTARSVLLPMLKPVLVIATIQSIIWDFKIFTQIYVMTNGGGVAGQNMVLNVYAYQEAFAGSNYGMGSAIGVVMTVLLMLITLAYLRAQRKDGAVV